MNSPENSIVEDKKSVVIMVHGTFATGDENGNAWWQRDSDFWQALSSHLGDNYVLPERGNYFKWSGNNSEEDRRLAGSQLLDALLDLERKEIPYHIVAHSHGGTVVWHALKLSVAPFLTTDLRLKVPKVEQLEFLRSWTTVGTPFFHHKIDKKYLKKEITTLFLCTSGFLLARLHRSILNFVFRWFQDKRHKPLHPLLQMTLHIEAFLWTIGIGHQIVNWSLRREENKAEQLALQNRPLS